MDKLDKKPKPLSKKLKKLWIDALNSGRFNQGLYNLHDSRTNKYCCLGVGVKVGALKNGGYSSLPGRTTKSLINKNDDLDWNFEKIAKWISKYV